MKLGCGFPNLWLTCCVSIWILIETLSIGRTQLADTESNGIPYRRVFVPSRDLEAIGLESFSAVDISVLEKLLQKDLESRQKSNSIDPTSDSSELVRLKSTYYVAKLVGADLLSECSLVTMVGSPLFGDRVTLIPWSLAVQSPTGRGIKTDTQGPANWLFDERGFPRIPVYPNGATGAVDANQRDFFCQFGWSARADSTSTANKLRFSFEIPKCANSCLVLALPPNAEVQDCSTVAKQVGDWSKIEERLTDWNDFSKDFMRDAKAANSPDSLWLIELGGSPVASFSIALGVGVRPQDDRNAIDGHRYMQLIRSQNLEHFVDGQEIRTICDAEVFVAAEQPRLRISLANGARLRRLSVNQQEVDWELDDGWIQSDIGSVLQESPATIPISVNAEFLMPLSSDKLESIDTPRVLFDRGYVMTGTTIVQSVSPWRLTHASCDASRIAETQGDAKATGVSRLEYSWYATPPSLTIGLELTDQPRRCEVITHLSNDAKGSLCSVRTKLFFAEQDSSQVKLEIAPGWSILSVQSLDPIDPVSVERDTATTENGQTLQVSWDRVLKNRVSELELRLYRNSEESAKQSRQVDSNAIMRLPGWKRSNTVVVEDSSQIELKLNDSLLDLLATEDSLPDWQRPLLSKMGKHKVFVMESQSLDRSFDSDLKTESDLSEISSPTVLNWHIKPSSHRASTMTLIDRGSNKELRARHEISLNLSSDRNDPISIVLPSKNIIWRLKVGNDWAPLIPLKSSEDSKDSTDSTAIAEGVWHFDVRQMPSACTVLAVVYAESSEDGEAMFPLPSVLNAEMQSQDARCRLRDTVIRTVGTPSTWSIDDSGQSFLQCNSSRAEAKIVLAAKLSESLFHQKWFVLGSECHMALDTFGSQKATLLFRSNTSAENAFVIELDDGWEPLTVIARTADRVASVPFRIDGRRLIVSNENGVHEGGTELQIDLIGPSLKKEFEIQSLGEVFSFRWPKFLNDAISVSQQRLLWLPRELKLAESEELNWGQEANRWPLWQWSRQSLAGLFGTSASSSPYVAFENKGAVEKRAMFWERLPEWAAAGWRAVSIDSPRVSIDSPGKATRGLATSTIVTATYSVDRVDSDRTYLALVLTILTLLTPRIILLRYHVAALIAASLIVCSHFAPVGVARFATTGLTGMSVGFMAFVIYRLLATPLNADKSITQRHTAKWSPNLGSLASLLFFGWGLTLSHSFEPRAIGDDGISGENSPVYQIVIPIDESGEMAGTTLYVPSEMLNVLTGKSDRANRTERGTYPTSARHSLRVGSRGRFNSGDQITMAYEFMVGDDLIPVRFPMNAAQMLLPRFRVDGIEINLGSRLKSTGFEWIWTPDKPGKRSVQIVAQPVLKSNEADRNRDSLTRLLDIAIIPIANATIEIETDPRNSLEIVSRGRVTDPTEGRFLAMLGAIDRLKCSVISPSSKQPSGFSIPSTNATDGLDAPVMHTELFLQNEVLQAKTIVDFPKGGLTGREIEIEADLQWLPIGTQWGDAEWIDTRPGSTLSKRRYILEWKNAFTSLSFNSPTTRDRQISVVWVPQSASQSLNVLFAECRERGTRRGTLRYSRASGANWSIEGIGAWIPAIGSKDRLDWPELKTNPLATSLRIPSNGGFGILKPKSLVDRPQQARVTTKWMVDPNRETLTSRIELLAGSSVSEPLVIDLQEDFIVTELYNRSGPIRYLLSRSNGKLHLQVLAERKSLEVSDLWIQAKRHDSEQWNGSAIGKWFELPWLTLPASVNPDQTLEIVASESTALRLESEPGWIFGKGQNASALNLAKSYSDIHASTLASSRYRVHHRNQTPVGKLVLKQVLESNPKEIELSAQFMYSVSTRPSFVIEIPASFKDRWQSESKITNIPCPVATSAWLQVHLPEPSMPDEDKPVAVVVRFFPRPEDLEMDSDWASRIHAIDERIPIYRFDAADEKSSKTDSSTRLSKAEPFASGLSVVRRALVVLDDNFMTTPAKRSVLIKSQYWIQGSKDSMNGGRQLEWRLGADVEVLAIEVNGRSIPFDQAGPLVQIPFVPLGICDDVRVYSRRLVASQPDDGVTVNAPELVGIEQSLVGGNRIAQAEGKGDRGALARACLLFLAQAEERWPNAERLEPGSELAVWKKHWREQATIHLNAWMNEVGAGERESFSQTVQQWHALVPLSERMRVKPHADLGLANPEPSSQIANGGNGSIEIESKQSSESQTTSGKWISMFGCLLILLSVAMVAPALSVGLEDRPWWSLLFLGVFAWSVFGSVLPALVLGCIGLIVAVDSYWMVTSRLPRNGLRGLRSL